MPVPSRPANRPSEPAGMRPCPSSSHAQTTGSGSISDAGVRTRRRARASVPVPVSEALEVQERWSAPCALLLAARSHRNRECRGTRRRSRRGLRACRLEGARTDRSRRSRRRLTLCGAEGAEAGDLVGVRAGQPGEDRRRLGRGVRAAGLDREASRSAGAAMIVNGRAAKPDMPARWAPGRRAGRRRAADRTTPSSAPRRAPSSAGAPVRRTPDRPRRLDRPRHAMQRPGPRPRRHGPRRNRPRGRGRTLAARPRGCGTGRSRAHCSAPIGRP